MIGRRLRPRADRTTVRFYDGATVVKVHPRQPPGGRATDVGDLPAEKTVTALQRAAAAHGPAIGAYADALLAVPLPWTRMRRVYALLGLVKRYGAGRVDETCALALAAELIDVARLKRMLALASPPLPTATTATRPVAGTRYLRAVREYRLVRPTSTMEVDHDA